jgi:hypothetical protein
VAAFRHERQQSGAQPCLQQEQQQKMQGAAATPQQASMQQQQQDVHSSPSAGNPPAEQHRQQGQGQSSGAVGWALLGARAGFTAAAPRPCLPAALPQQQQQEVQRQPYGGAGALAGVHGSRHMMSTVTTASQRHHRGSSGGLNIVKRR